MKVEKVGIDPPRRPDQIELRQVLGEPLALTPERLPLLIEDFKSGKRAPLNYMCLTTDQWAELKHARQDFRYYAKQAESYFDDVERQNEAVHANQKPP